MNTDRTKRILPGGLTRLLHVTLLVTLVLGLVALPAAQAVSPASSRSGSGQTKPLAAVLAPSTAPVAVNDVYSTTMGVPLSVAAPGVLANDTHDISTTLTAIKVTNPTRNGVATLSSDGSLVYVPPTAGFTGVDRFTYKANDGTADSNVATVTIAVGNHAPVAVNDAYTTTQGTPLTIAAPGVLTNDTDADSDPLTAVKVGDPVHGTVTVNVNGTFTYTPTTGYSGADSFTYTATDGAANSNTATVNVTVQGPEANLIGYWKFDEGAGTTAADSSTYHNDGTLSGGAVFTTTVAPITSYADLSALNPVTTTGVVTVPNSAINRLTNNFTVMGWIKPSNVGIYQRMISTAQTKSANGWSFGLFNAQMLLSTNGKKDYYSPYSTGMKTGQWYHITAVMDSSNGVTFYFDGMSVGTVTGTLPAVADTDDALLIGANTASGSSTLTDPFNGLIDDVRVYNRALSASEVAGLVGVPPCSEPVLRARVMLGEKSGTISLDGTCTYPLTYAGDSGNGGSGIMISTATTIEGNGATIERSVSAPAFRLLKTSPAITIRNLTLRGGNVIDSGGGLYASGNITLTNVRFENNITNHPAGVTSYANVAGAVYAAANLTADRCTFVGNQTDGWGGALSFGGLSGRITNSVFTNNISVYSGAGVRSSNAAGTLTLLDNTFTDQYKNPQEAVLINGNATLTNNIFDNYKAALVASGAVTVTEDYNLLAANDIDPQALNGATILRGGHDRIAASPRFVNAAAANYNLQQNSPAIDLGTNAGVATDAAGNPRPFAGTSVDIGAYEYQGTGIPSLSITKAGPPYVSTGSQFRFFLTVINESSNPLNDLRITEQLPAGATYVAGSATYSGTLNGSMLTWDLAPLAPNQMKRVEYQVTAAQDLVSNNYSVSSISTPSITASGPAITTPYNTNARASGFFPYPDGFSFENWGGDNRDSNITVDDMVKIYGTGVCKTQNPCVLYAAAEAERQAKAASSDGGHCAGMAGASLKIFNDPNVNPGDFQPGALLTFDLTKDNSRRLISWFMSTQGDTAAVTAGLPITKDISGAKAIVDALKANYADPNPTDRYLLSLKDINGGSGHRVTPYAIVQQADPNQYWIYAYDNNSPNNFNRVFKVTNYLSGTWIYEGGATSPTAPPSIYRDDDGSQPDHLVLRSFRWVDAFPKKCTSACVSEPFNKIGPANGATNQPGSVTLSWQPSAGATSYLYAYATTSTLSSWYSAGTALTKTVTGLKPGTTYYWQMVASNGGGWTYANGFVTSTWSFTTMSPTVMSEVTAMAAPTAVSAPLVESLPTYDFQLEGEGSLMVTRSDGKRAGIDPATGQFIAEIPGAEQISSEGGLGMNVPAIIRIPHVAGMTYALRVSNAQNKYGNPSATADLNISGGGFVTRLKGLKLDSPADFGAQPSGNGLYSPMASAQSGSNDVVGVTFDGDNHQVGFTSSALDSDTPALSMAVSQSGAPDFSFKVGGAQMSSGHTLSAGIDPQTGKLSIKNDDPASHTYSLDVERINLDGSKTTYQGTTSGGTGTGTLVDLGPSWTGGAPTITQQNRIYLPIVLR